MVIEQMVMSVVASVTFGLSFYIKKNEPFDAYKLITTAVIGALIGLIAGMLNVIPTEEYVVAQLASYAGLSLGIQNILKYVYKQITGQSIKQ